jgi:hypothetical protein
MFRYYTRFRKINGQPGDQYDILKAAYEVDKTLTNKENSWVNKINETYTCPSSHLVAKLEDLP